MNPWTLMPDWELTEIHRQGADSGILEAAHEVSTHGRMLKVCYGPKRDTVRLKRLDPRAGELLNRFRPAVDGAIITHTNKLRAWFNNAYHEKLVGSGPVDVGDRVVALGGMPYEAARVVMENGVPRATGEFIMVHNSMMGTVLKASHRDRVSELTVQLDEHHLATPSNPVVILTGACPTAQFGAEGNLPLNSPDRPRSSHPWDYAYALTAHKAQGSEFPHVVIIDERPYAYAQWMYTAITRAQKAAVVIAWNEMGR
jgi:ATP-dependent exoDNAse (exonuclease V) alpha subunit